MECNNIALLQAAEDHSLHRHESALGCMRVLSVELLHNTQGRSPMALVDPIQI